MNKELDIIKCLIDDARLTVCDLSNVCVRGKEKNKNMFDIFTKANKQKVFQSYAIMEYYPRLKVTKNLNLDIVKEFINKYKTN